MTVNQITVIYITVMSSRHRKDTKVYPSDQLDRFLVRMPDGMRDAVAQRAARNRRSMNSEIVTILERVLREEKNDDGVKFGDRAPSSSQNQPVSAG